ncbi:MAG: rhodanese-like domain-containing protein [Acidimicrobiales bacterium]
MHPFEVDVDHLAAAVAAGAAVVDVRNPDEFETGHVPGALLIPLGELVERVEEVPAAPAVYVICHLGGRSLKATEFLRAQGQLAWSVAGGTEAWVKAGHPTEA